MGGNSLVARFLVACLLLSGVAFVARLVGVEFLGLFG